LIDTQNKSPLRDGSAIHAVQNTEREPENVTLLATQIRHKQHSDFKLTGAIQPCPESRFTPREGFRLEKFRDPVSRRRIPMLAASVSSDHLFDVFLDLIEPLGELVDVVLETSHHSNGDYHDDLRRTDIDLPVLASHFFDYEDLILNDGCTGVAVVARDLPIEVQFDEHKLLFVYAHNLKPFRQILRAHGIRRNDQMPLIAESEHLHHTTVGDAEEFRRLCCQIGAGDFDSVLSDENGWLGC
jgi:hypothetical protein